MATKENEIDLLELLKILWTKRKTIFKVILISIVTGVIIAISIPRQYTTTVILASDSNSSNNSSVLALASRAGINMGQDLSDALLSPSIYPTIIESTPFILGLFDIEITDSKNNTKKFYEYVKEDQKTAWFMQVINFPFKILSLFSSDKEGKEIIEEANSQKIILSKEQAKIISFIRGNIDLSVDNKSGIIELSCTMQDPYVSAFIADTVTSYLQSYIITYRTQKTKNDLDFIESLYQESKLDYYKAQQKYSRYIDENRNVISANYRVTQERLQNEMALAFTVYNQTAQQLQMARIKVQDNTPVYTVIEPAITPLSASAPKKVIIVIAFMFLGFCIACGWILMKEVIRK